ncbi:unnamed protein product, partial [Dicrocoelium dendriticum]
IIYLLLTVHVVFKSLEVAGLNYCTAQLSKVRVECLEESVVLCGIDKENTMEHKENRCRYCSLCQDNLNICKIRKLAPLTSCPEAQHIRQSLIEQRTRLR